MLGEINRDFYCVADYLYANDRCKGCLGKYTRCSAGCLHRKHKWPTPEEFKKEYGKEWGKENGVYILVYKNKDKNHPPFNQVHEEASWVSYPYHAAVEWGFKLMVFACTPWGKPPDGWRPE